MCKCVLKKILFNVVQYTSILYSRCKHESKKENLYTICRYEYITALNKWKCITVTITIAKSKWWVVGVIGIKPALIHFTISVFQILQLWIAQTKFKKK